MKFSTRIQGAWLVLWLLCGLAIGRAQSLGDLAREQSAQKKRPAATVITEEDLEKLRQSSAINVGGTTPSRQDTVDALHAKANTTSAPDPSTAIREQARAEAYRYTVSWAAIPDVMDAAAFSFVVPTIASREANVALTDVQIIANPCTKGAPRDESPQLYSRTKLHILLGCPGLGKNGRGAVALARLAGILTAQDGARPGHYSFKGVLGYYAIYTEHHWAQSGQRGASGTLEGSSRWIELRLPTTGTLDIERVTAP